MSTNKRLAHCESLEARLRAMLEEDRTHEIDQETLDGLRAFYEVQDPAVPTSLRINIQGDRYQLTDLPEEGRFAEFIRTVNIPNVLSAHDLRGLDELGPVGVAARRLALDVIRRNLAARISATKNRPRSQELDGRTYRVYNDLVTLRGRWGVPQLAELRRTLKANGVFDQQIRPKSGLARTSSTPTNPDMELRQWSTDSCMSGLIMKEENPGTWWRSMLTNAAFIITADNVAAMMETLRNPEWYRSGDASHGIAHIFLPERKNFDDEGIRWDDERDVPHLDSVKEDPAWFNRQRLESQALVLRELLLAVIAGAFFEDRNPSLAAHGAGWGFHWVDGRPAFPADNLLLNETQKQYIIEAIQVCAMYLMSVQWDGQRYDFEAPTVSSWEEAPLRGGCASDTGYILHAFELLRDVLTNPAYDANPTIAEVRTLLSEITVEHPSLGRADGLLGERPYADFRNAERLDEFLKAGQAKLAQMVIIPVVTAVDGIARPTPSGVQQYPSRPPDMSLLLLGAEYPTFDDNKARDAYIRTGVVAFAAEHLMNAHPERAHGMKRYGTFLATTTRGMRWLFDSYLNREFHFALLFGGLVKRGFANFISNLHRSIGPWVESRQETGTLSPRDQIIHEAYVRLVEEADSSATPNKDATTTDGMEERQRWSLPELTAQWTIGPAAAVIALAKAKLNLLSRLNELGEAGIHDEELQWRLKEVERWLTRFINLSVATIVQNVDADGNEVLRADGTPLPAKYNVMEAFQAVPDVDGNHVWRPGEHTLPWTAALIYHGLKLAEEAARQEEICRGIA